MTRRVIPVCFFVLLAWLLVLPGCNNTPTVPVPPPDMREVTTTSPDADGFATIQGETGAAEPDSVVLLFNEDIESGVMETAGSDGSFQAVIEADVGHTLVLQLKVENALSYERYITVE
jgi:hypothetical protein